MNIRNGAEKYYYIFTDANGRRVERPGCRDKRATEKRGNDAETQAANERAGLIEPHEQRRAEQGRRPIGDHVDEYIDSLKAKGDGMKHTRTTRTYIDWIIAKTSAARIADLTPSAVTQALAKLRAGGRSARTINAYATAVQGFSRWLWLDGRRADHPWRSSPSSTWSPTAVASAGAWAPSS